MPKNSDLYKTPLPKNQHADKRLLSTIFAIFLRILQVFFHQLCKIIYSRPSEQLPAVDNLILLDSATTLAQKIRTRKLTSVEVVQAFIDRSKSINGIIKAIVDDRFEAALEDARKADELIKTGGRSVEELAKEYPFLGVPFTTKDCIAVKGLSQTGGLYQRRNFKAAADAECIAWLRKAGAIPLAITNVPELALWYESYNKHYGRTNNPYNTHRIAGGSSGGEGALLSSAGSPMGIGSDIGGSIRMPAFFNGIFGHKPSTGVGSLDGTYPLPNGALQRAMVTAGPLSRFACDLLPMLKIIAPAHVKLLQLDRVVDITKLRYFYMEDDGGSPLITPVEPEIKAAIRKIVEFLSRTHKKEAKKLNIEEMKYSMDLWFAKMKAPGDQLAKELANNEGTLNLHIEMIKALLGLSDHTIPVLGAGILDKWNCPYNSDQHKKLIERADNLKLLFQEILCSDGIFIYPSHPTAAPYHVEPIVKPFNVAYTGVFNFLGFPVTQVPMGLNKNGLPIGVQIVANVNQDRLTIAVAEELERAFGGWVSPSPIL